MSEGFVQLVGMESPCRKSCREVVLSLQQRCLRLFKLLRTTVPGVRNGDLCQLLGAQAHLAEIAFQLLARNGPVAVLNQVPNRAGGGFLIRKNVLATVGLQVRAVDSGRRIEGRVQ